MAILIEPIEPPQNLIQSSIPYIESVSGVAIVNTSSKVLITGGNFTPESNIICDLGEISNITRSPNLITFDILVTAPGSGMIAVGNGNDISTVWNSDYTPLLIARNPLNLTNGWLDFRTANLADLGVVTSYINQNLATKNFANSGFIQDINKGLMIGASGNTNSSTNYLQLNNYIFPLDTTIIEIIIGINTASTNINRVNFGVGGAIIGSNNFALALFDSYGTFWAITRRYNASLTSIINLPPMNPLTINSTLHLKIVYNYYNKTIGIYKLNDLSDFESDSIVTENIPLEFYESGYTAITSGIPLFRFFNPNSLSSVIAMKIN